MSELIIALWCIFWHLHKTGVFSFFAGNSAIVGIYTLNYLLFSQPSSFQLNVIIVKLNV